IHTQHFVAVASFTRLELILLTVLFGVISMLWAPSLSYTLPNCTPADIREAGVLSLIVQFLTIMLIAYGLIVLMASNVIPSEAGFSAVPGLVGFLVGKAPPPGGKTR